MKNPYFDVLHKTIQVAEEFYDQVIRRWGNIHFARSSVYDWLWSEEFCLMCHSLSELEKGRIRLQVMELFGVKPWPWHQRQRLKTQPDIDIR